MRAEQIDEWRAMVDETDDEEVEHKRAQDPDLQKKQAISHYNLGMCYENGSTPLRLFHAASGTDNVHAATRYGVEGVDIGKAFTHYRLSAGLPPFVTTTVPSMVTAMPFAVTTVPFMVSVLTFWAAELGHPEGMCNVGCCYLVGR